MSKNTTDGNPITIWKLISLREREENKRAQGGGGGGGGSNYYIASIFEQPTHTFILYCSGQSMELSKL